MARISCLSQTYAVKGGSNVYYINLYFSKSEVYLSLSSYIVSHFIIYFVLIKEKRVSYHTCLISVTNGLGNFIIGVQFWAAINQCSKKLC